MSVSTVSSSAALALVGDVGGTNARFSLADLSKPQSPTIHDTASVPSADYPTLNDAIAAYFKKAGVQRKPEVASIAVAGPVVDGKVALTNLRWHTSETDICTAGFKQVRLLNDFGALALSVSLLKSSDLHQIGPVGAVSKGHCAIIGAGTGLGVAALARSDTAEIPMMTEGGHIGFAPTDLVELDIATRLMKRHGRISAERILSGPGLFELYTVLCEIRGETPDAAGPPEVAARAAKEPGTCREAVERFCSIFGAFAGDVALIYGARGGVFIAGGIAPQLLPFLESGAFRAQFEAKGRLSHFVKPIPTQVITRPDAALLGAARAAAALL